MSFLSHCFQDFFFSLEFRNLTLVYFGEGFFGFILFGVHYLPESVGFMSFAKLNFSAII